MNCKTKKFVYRIGSVAGCLELNYSDYPEKNYYVKVRKGVNMLYYAKDGDFSNDQSKAANLPETVSYALANEFKKLNYFDEVIPYATTKKF